MSWRSPFLFFVIMLILCALTTVFIRVPLPSRGYFNFGDVAVVFAGLMAGKHLRGASRWLGPTAGGAGSAIADIIGGYAMFAPITLVVKFVEGGLAALAGATERPTRFLYLVLGGVVLVGGYFIAEWSMPSFGLPGALTELLPNTIQAVGGAVGGYILFKVLDMIIEAGEV
jgi:uncharacterized membrane protein